MDIFSPTFEELATGSLPFYDNTPVLREIHCNAKKIFVGPKGSGKSTFLSMIEAFISKDKDTTALFDSLEIGKTDWWEQFKRHRINTLPVIKLSFDGIFEETFDAAVQKILERLSAQMIAFLPGGVDYKDTFSEDVYETYALDLIENKCDSPSDALRLLIRFVSEVFPEHKYDYGEHFALLIDEPIYPMLAAEKYGYKDEMSKFLRHFLDIRRYVDLIIGVSELVPDYYHIDIEDIFEQCIFHCFGRYSLFMSKENLLNISSEYTGISADVLAEQHREFLDKQPEIYKEDRFQINEKNYYWRSYPYSDAPVGENIYYMSAISQLTGVEYEKIDPNSGCELTADNIEFVKKRRATIAYEEEQARIRHEEYRREMKARYSQPLPDYVELPTEFAGIQKMFDIPQNCAYDRLNKLLRNLYKRYTKKNNSESLYSFMNGFKENEHTDWNNEHRQKLEEFKEKYGTSWDVRLDGSGTYWQQFSAERDDLNISFCHVKVYASTGTKYVAEYFIGAVQNLLENANKSFYAKVGKQVRKNPMCFWVMQEDLHILQDYFKDKELVRNLDFLPYKDNLAYSRELYFGESYNSLIIDLMRVYFKTVSSSNEIDFRDMCQCLIDAWNGQLSEDEHFFAIMENTPPQVLIVMMESFAIITGYKEFTDDNILLSSDRELWGLLTEGYCWADLAEEYNEIRKDKKRNEEYQ